MHGYLPPIDTVAKHDTTVGIHFDNSTMKKKAWFLDQASVWKVFLSPLEEGAF